MQHSGFGNALKAIKCFSPPSPPSHSLATAKEEERLSRRTWSMNMKPWAGPALASVFSK